MQKRRARAAGVSEAHANDIHTVEPDYLMSNDGTTHLTIDMYNNLKHPHIADVSKQPDRTTMVSRQPRDRCFAEKMRDFAKEHGITFMRAPVYVIR